MLALAVPACSAVYDSGDYFAGSDVELEILIAGELEEGSHDLLLLASGVGLERV